jgi:hypothetical protein
LVEVAVALGGVIEWFQHLSGAVETIEVGPSVLKITKEVLGWGRTSEYPVDSCSELKLQDETVDAHGLQCRFGRWKMIEFGDELSAEQSGGSSRCVIGFNA